MILLFFTIHQKCTSTLLYDILFIEDVPIKYHILLYIKIKNDYDRMSVQAQNDTKLSNPMYC